MQCPDAIRHPFLEPLQLRDHPSFGVASVRPNGSRIVFGRIAQLATTSRHRSSVAIATLLGPLKIPGFVSLHPGYSLNRLKGGISERFRIDMKQDRPPLFG